MIYKEVPTAFLWYDNLKKQHIEQENAKGSCYNGLVAPREALLPFQFFKEDPSKPVAWSLIKPCGSVAIDLTNNLGKLQAIGVDGGIYVYYLGDGLAFKNYLNQEQPLNIPPGVYYSSIEFESGETYYSELINVVDDLEGYIKLTFWDDVDLKPIKYAGIDFKQILYLDTFISSTEPEIEEEAEADVNNMPVPTFQKLTIKHRAALWAPDFLKVALTSLQMHSNIELDSPSQSRSGFISRVEVTSAQEEGIPFNVVNLVITEQVVTKNSCPDDIPIQDPNPWL